jgi:hypothetical protein
LRETADFSLGGALKPFLGERAGAFRPQSRFDRHGKFDSAEDYLNAFEELVKRMRIKLPHFRFCLKTQKTGVLL